MNSARQPSDVSPTAPAVPPHRVAIVGSGPSGCFTAQALRKRIPDVRIDVFDSLPTPYGLIRHGIAPDHQGAKAVHRQFDRLFAQDGVRFIGNTVIGTDLPMTELAESYDAVVLATGLAHDRGLGVPQDAAARVIGAGELLRLLNSDPDSALRYTPSGVPDLGSRIAIVGTGNVAVDVVRLLTKSAAELDSSDIDDIALRALNLSGITTIHVLGRSGREQAKWDAAMLKELAAVSTVDLRLDGEPFDAGTAADGATVLVDVRFHQALYAIYREGEQTTLVTREHGEASKATHFAVDTVISAIGFDDDSPLSEFDYAPHVFRVGGCHSGRLGNLAENRKLAATTAQTVVEHLTLQQPIRSDVDPMLPAGHVSFEGWRRIDAAETRRALPGRCRTKFTTRAELLGAAQPTAPSTIAPRLQKEIS
ncbi:FAD-dependent oxidoreductase [Nocardia vaccinii]|uniref:FAD-dependent oxidoreductase n=1 Tax=Nocardia vaccinii TaxID=1822 RepID=UPI0009FFA745|nr:FAD-dependent oxidoreductase [Nocardia vaccinii]